MSPGEWWPSCLGLNVLQGMFHYFPLIGYSSVLGNEPEPCMDYGPATTVFLFPVSCMALNLVLTAALLSDPRR